MEHLKIMHERENHLFSRKEISVALQSNATPNKEEAKKMISEKFSSDPEAVHITKINGKFGSKNFVIEAEIYSSKERKNHIVKKPKIKKTENK